MVMPKIGDKILIINPGHVTSGRYAKDKIVTVVHLYRKNVPGFFAICDEKINTQTSEDNSCGCEPTDEWYINYHTAFFQLENVIFEPAKSTAVSFFLKED